MKNLRKLLLMTLTFCLLSGCGKENTEESRVEVLGEEIDYSCEKKQKDAIVQEVLPESKKRIPVNTTNETFSADAEGIHLAKICAASGDKLYFCQWARDGHEASLYQLKIGETALKKVELDIPEGMDIYGMATDKTGNLYLLMRTALTEENVTSMIQELDSEGNVIRSLDISEAIQGKLSIVQSFLVKDNGDFYIKGMNASICINSEGIALWEMKDEPFGICDSYTAAVGKDGEVYITYKKADVWYLGKMNGEDGTIVKEYFLSELEGDDKLLAIGQGTDSDFLLYSASSGVWAWNQTEGKLEKRADLSEARMPSEEYIVIRTFLEDGRLLQVVNIAEVDTLSERIYKYIPAGR